MEHQMARQNIKSKSNVQLSPKTKKTQLMIAIKHAIAIHNSKQFKALLDKHNVLNDTELNDLKNQFHPDNGNLMMWDLFHKLDPLNYKNTSFENLTSYEKLYFMLFEPYYAQELNHRLNFAGELDITWKNKLIDKVNLNGQNPGFSLIQFKDHLLQYSTKNNISKGFKNAVAKIIELTPQSGIHILNGNIKQNEHIFYFNHVGHQWCTLLTDNKLYLINMGLGSESTPGIQVFDVPKAKKRRVLASLIKWEKTNLIDQINILEMNIEDPMQLQVQVVEKMQQLMKFEHFIHFPKKFNLTKIEDIHIPKQTIGNCGYYSLKGLLLALTYHENQKYFPKGVAYKRSLKDTLAFIKQDYANAIDDYKTHSLHPNPALLLLAKKQLLQYQPRGKKLIKDPSLDPMAYQLHQPRRKCP
jgi:hypothetical protein